MVIHHLALARDWAAARAAGEYRVSTLGADLDEVGFIHASFSDQLAATAARFYATVDEPLVVLAIDTERLGCDVVVEPAPDGGRFPHIYGPVPTGAVVEVVAARMVDGQLVTGSG